MRGIPETAGVPFSKSQRVNFYESLNNPIEPLILLVDEKRRRQTRQSIQQID